MSASTEFDSECPICLNILIDGAEIGSPDVCTHRFCLLCIIEWSRNTNTCPIDRSIFREILVKDTIGGNVVRRVPVEDKRPDDDEDDDDRTECEICGQSDREDRMLLCDHCDNGYHMECLTPALDTVPDAAWFCPECAGIYGGQVVAGDAVVNRPRRRIIPRTEFAERIRAVIERRLGGEESSSTTDDDDESDEVEEEIDEQQVEMPAKVTAEKLTRKQPTAVKKTPRRAKRTRRTKGTTGGRRRRRRRCRRRRTTRLAPVDSVHKRLANQLGVSAPRPGHFLPSKLNKSSSSDRDAPSSSSAAIGSAPLYLFGNSLDMHTFDDDDEDDRAPISRNAMRFDRPIRRAAAPAQSQMGNVADTNQMSTSGDLLDSIIEHQRMTLAPAAYMRVCRDGTLEPRPSIDRYYARLDQKMTIAGTNTNPSKPSTTTDGAVLTDDDMDLEVATAPEDEPIAPTLPIAAPTAAPTTTAVRKSRWQPMDEVIQQPRQKAPLIQPPMMVMTDRRAPLYSRPPPPPPPASSAIFNQIMAPPPPHSGLLPTPANFLQHAAGASASFRPRNDQLFMQRTSAPPPPPPQYTFRPRLPDQQPPLGDLLNSIYSSPLLAAACLPQLFPHLQTDLLMQQQQQHQQDLQLIQQQQQAFMHHQIPTSTAFDHILMPPVHRFQLDMFQQQAAAPVRLPPSAVNIFADLVAPRTRAPPPASLPQRSSTIVEAAPLPTASAIGQTKSPQTPDYDDEPAPIDDRLNDFHRLMAEATSTTGDDDNETQQTGSEPAHAPITDDESRRQKLVAKLNYQGRVEEEVKQALRPFYNKKRISKDEYKLIMSKTVPKICKNKGQINPLKIQAFVQTYVQRAIGKSKRRKAAT